MRKPNWAAVLVRVLGGSNSTTHHKSTHHKAWHEQPSPQQLPLTCPIGAFRTRSIAFIMFSADIHDILDHIEVDSDDQRTTG